MAIGKKTGGGSRKGRPGRVAAAVKEAILVAFDEVGGKDYLIGVARSNPEVFCRLLAKVLPVQLAGDPEQPIKAVLSIEAHRERALAIIRKAFEPYVEHEGPRPLMPPPKLVQ
jgi:hypothetical protein